MRIKRIGPLSLGKIMGAAGAIMGLFFGGLMSLGSLLFSPAVGQPAEASLLFGAAAVIVLPIFYGVVSFVGGLVYGVIYNMLSGIVGGIEIELDGHGADVF